MYKSKSLLRDMYRSRKTAEEFSHATPPGSPGGSSPPPLQATNSRFESSVVTAGPASDLGLGLVEEKGWLWGDVDESVWNVRYTFGTVTESFRVFYKQREMLFKRVIHKMGFEEGLSFALLMCRLVKISHRNLLSIKGVSLTLPRPFFAVHYVSNGSLYAALLGPRKRNLAISTRVKIARGIASGLQYLHTKGCIHGALSPSNVLLLKDDHPVLSDFGLLDLRYSKPLVLGDEPNSSAGPSSDDILQFDISRRVNKPTKYDAPEVLKLGQIVLASDIYSFGVLLLELSLAADAFGGMSGEDVASRVASGFRPPIPDSVSFDISSIVLKCFRERPASRGLMSSIHTDLSHITAL